MSQTITVNAGSGDCWADVDDNFEPTGQFMWMGGTPAIDGNPKAWIPFVVNLPRLLDIDSAVIKWFASQSRSDDTVKVLIGCELADNPAAPDSKGSLFARSMTSAKLTVNLEHYTAGTQYSYDITDSVQEILNRAGWASGNTLAVLVFDNGTTTDKRRQVATVENPTYQEPVLEITFPTFFPRASGVI